MKEQPEPVVREMAQPSEPRAPVTSRAGTGAGVANGLLALQRLAGNRAVSDLVGRASPDQVAVLQRKSLGQTGWLPTLAAERSRQPLVSDGRDVNVYYDRTRPPAQTERTKALTTAAERNAHVGGTVHASGWPWTAPRSYLDNTKQDTIDPFYYRAVVDFGTRVAKTDKAPATPHQMMVLFQHASRWTGYATQLHDTSHPGMSKVAPSMYDTGGTKPLKDNLYGNQHVTNVKTPLIGVTGQTTETGYDAYTKIAGEGARWQCVRNHAAHLSDDSAFFLTEKGRTYGVTFVGLWLSWENVFGKKYNISDSEVAEAIWKQGRLFREKHYLENFTPIPEKDYDLDAGHTYVEEEDETAPVEEESAPVEEESAPKTPTEARPTISPPPGFGSLAALELAPQPKEPSVTKSEAPTSTSEAPTTVSDTGEHETEEGTTDDLDEIVEVAVDGEVVAGEVIDAEVVDNDIDGVAEEDEVEGGGAGSVALEDESVEDDEEEPTEIVVTPPVATAKKKPVPQPKGKGRKPKKAPKNKKGKGNKGRKKK